MKRFLLALTMLAMAPGIAAAQSRSADTFVGPTTGTQEFTLSGTGNSNNDFDSGSFGITGSYGWYFTPNLLGSVRQSVNWAGSENADDTINGTTRLAADYHFGSGRFRPFVGANVGLIYGDGVNDTGILSPEVGIKYYVNDTTFILALAEYQIFFEDSDDIGDRFDDSAFAYTIGLGFTF